MAKIFIKTNFSFPNLVKKYNKVKKGINTDTHYSKFRKAVAKNARKMIKGSELRPLAPTTREQRKKAGFGIVPLYKTKSLYNSIKGDSKGFHLLSYGKMHNDGTRGKNIPQREFIMLNEEAENEFTEAFIEGIDKALKK